MVQFSSVTQSCLTLCSPMNHSMPGLPIHHPLPESTQTHVHWVGDAIQPSHPLLSPSPPILNLSQHQGLFKMSQLFASGGQNIGVSASTSIIPMDTQDFQWTPLGILPMNTFRMDGLDLLAVQGTLKSLLQHHSSKASILQSAAFFIGSFGICASKFPFLLIQFSITFSGKKSESWIKHSVVRMHACLLASTPFTAMCL